MKNFDERTNNMQENTTVKPARKVRKRTVAAIVLTVAVFAGALTFIGVFGKKMSKTAVSAERLLAVTNTVELKQEKANTPASTGSYQYFAPAQSGNNQSWNLVKGSDLVEVKTDYDNSDHLYKFEFKGKKTGTGDIELSYQVKGNQIKTAKMRLTVDENMNVSKVN